MRLYNAVCAWIEAHAAYLHTDTLEHEFENADWNGEGDAP